MPIPLPVIADTFRCALEWVESGSGQTAVNVIHITASSSVPVAADIFEALQDTVTADMWGPCKSTAAVQTVQITPLDGTSSTTSFPTGGTAQWSGETGGDFVPAAAALVKFQTGLRGRNHRGRVFLPFMTEGDMSNGFVTPAVVTAMQAAWSAFRTGLLADTVPLSLVVASYDRKHAGAGAIATAVSNIVVESAIGTQRRRQGRLR